MAGEKQNSITGIIGAKGSGKTFYAKKIYAAAPCAIAIDSQREYTRGLTVSSWDHFVNHVDKQKKFHVIFLPLEQEDMEFACRVARAKRNCLVVFEEIHLYCSSAYIAPHLKRFILLARHSSCDMVYTSQRFQNVHNDIKSQTDTFILFRVSEPRDLKAISERFGESVGERVRQLKDHEHVVINVRDWRPDHVLDSSDFVRNGSGMVHKQLRGSGGIDRQQRAASYVAE